MPTHKNINHHQWTLQYVWLVAPIYLLRAAILSSKLISSDRSDSIGHLAKQFKIKRRTIAAPSHQQGRTIKLHIYSPMNDGFDAAKRPVHVNWHGSGFVLPLHGDDSYFCAFLAATLQISVIDADYRKAPEYPFPAAVEDAKDVMLFVFASRTSWDTNNTTVGGFSAGGNLSLGQASIFHSRIRAVTAVYPPTNFLLTPQDRKAPEECKGALPDWMVALFDQSYILPTQDRRDPLLSVLFCDFSKFPPALFVSTGQGDTLYKEGRAIIDRARSEGHTNATFSSVEGVAHAWDKSVSGVLYSKRNTLYSEVSDVIMQSWV